MSEQQNIRCILCVGKRPREQKVGYACERCHDWLYQLLNEIQAYHSRMAELLLPGASNADTGGKKHGKLDFGQPPLHLEALNLIGPATEVHMYGEREAWQNWHCQVGDNPPVDQLGSWIRMIWEERSYAGRDMPGFGAMCAELRRQLDWMCGREWVGEFAEEMRQVRNSMRAVAAVEDGTSDRTFIGACTNVAAGESEECGAELSARPDDIKITCRDCGTDWPQSRWLMLGQVQTQEAS